VRASTTARLIDPPRPLAEDEPAYSGDRESRRAHADARQCAGFIGGAPAGQRRAALAETQQHCASRSERLARVQRVVRAWDRAAEASWPRRGHGEMSSRSQRAARAPALLCSSRDMARRRRPDASTVVRTRSAIWLMSDAAGTDKQAMLADMSLMTAIRQVG